MGRPTRALILALAGLFVSFPSGCVRHAVITPGLIGLVEHDGQLYPELLSRETRASRHMQRLRGIGFHLSFPDRREHRVETVHFLPGVPKSLGESFGDASPEDAPNGIATKPVSVRGDRYFYWHLEDSDPVGQYRIEVRIDGQLQKTLAFDIVD